MIADCGSLMANGEAAPADDASGYKMATQVALLKSAFSVADSLGTGRVMHQELQLSMKAPQGTIMKSFPGQATAIQNAVNEYCGELQLASPPRSMISLDEFVLVCKNVLTGGAK